MACLQGRARKQFGSAFRIGDMGGQSQRTHHPDADMACIFSLKFDHVLLWRYDGASFRELGANISLWRKDSGRPSTEGRQNTYITASLLEIKLLPPSFEQNSSPKALRRFCWGASLLPVCAFRQLAWFMVYPLEKITRITYL